MSPYEAPVTAHMSSPVRTIPAGAPVADAYNVLRERAISSLAVLDARGEPAGVITRSDLLRLGRAKVSHVRRAPLLALPDVPVSEVMHPGLVTVGAEATVRDAARAMVQKGIHRVFVAKPDGSLAGVVSTLDVMRVVAEHRSHWSVRDFMSAPVITVRTTDTLARATDSLADAGVAGVVVLDEQDAPAGFFTQVEALQTREWPEATPVEDAMNLAVLCMNVRTPVHRAASAAAEMRVRRVIAVEARQVCGLLTGIDFARAAL